MNKRIKELMAQAGADTSGKWMGVENAEKFAELIVEEMHDFIMEEVGNDNGIPDPGKIKEHFGVGSGL